MIHPDNAIQALIDNGSVGIRVKRANVRHVKFTMLNDEEVAVCVANMPKISRIKLPEAITIIGAMNDITSIA